METIRNVYYNTNSPACFAGADAVLRECKKKNKSITKKQVEEFLSKQETYTLHRQARRRFDRNVTKTSGLDVDWQADLADMRNLKHWNNGYNYILVCIDVLSRFGFAVPLKKKTPELVSNAFEQIISSGRLPWTLTTDRGTEFKGVFQDFLRKHDIKHKFATSPDVKCAIAERYIRTLKSRIWRYFTRYKTKRYIDILPDLVSAINHSHHRTIKRTPASINSKNQSEVWEFLYQKRKKAVKPKFKTGDQVRISIEKHVLSKGYRPNYSREIFVVSKILKREPATYKLKDADEEIIDGVFYNEELVRVLPDRAPVKRIQTLKRSERRNGELWHLVRYEDKKEAWVRNDDLVSI